MRKNDEINIHLGRKNRQHKYNWQRRRSNRFALVFAGVSIDGLVAPSRLTGAPHTSRSRDRSAATTLRGAEKYLSRKKYTTRRLSASLSTRPALSDDWCFNGSGPALKQPEKQGSNSSSRFVFFCLLKIHHPRHPGRINDKWTISVERFSRENE